MKFCKKCDTHKAIEFFSKKPGTKDGKSSYCKPCEKAKVAKWEKENPESTKARKAKWASENKEKIREASRRHRKKNPDYESNWRKANPEKISEVARNNRAMRRKAEGKHAAADVRFIFDSQRGLCASCKKKLIKSGKNRFHVDHIVPLSKGGSNWASNLQCLCPLCNARKGAKDPFDWAKENGKLL